LGGGSNVRANKTVSTLLPHQGRPSRWRLKVDGNVCWSISQIDNMVFSSFFRSGVHGHPRRHRRLGRGDSSEARMLVRRWWISRSSPTSSMVGDRSWSKTAHGHPPDQRATTICVSLRVAGLFIDSQSLFSDSAFSDFVMLEARRLLRHSSWRRWRWAAAARYSGCRKS
jgi:hypothetical protein